MFSFKKYYRSISRNFQIYWESYGKWKALFESPFLYASLVFSLPIYWGFSKIFTAWYDTVIDIIPSILGFTIAGYAFLLSIGNREFWNALKGRRADENNEPSPYMKVNGAFVHFTVLNFFSILYALIAKVLELRQGWFSYVGVFIFIYALFSALAIVFQIIALADCFDKIPPD
jgi:hypothetical protein